MRIMGLDYGDKTVGVAISDELLITAQPIETIVRERSNKLRKTYQRIEALISEYEVEKIVIGRPLNMNGTEGERIEVDERLTTVEANRILEESGVANSARKEYIDKMAAAIILQSYLDSRSK